MLGSNAADPVPNYISLDISEIDYNGSLEKFDQDPEVLESIRDLKAGQRDMDKECPTMTMIWEGGRWCCLEGRTLYILRALEWKGQVRVRVLVDKDPMLLAVTEDYWKASGMAMAAGENMKAGTPSTIESHASTTIDPRIDMNVVVAEASISIDQPAQMSIAAVDTGVTTVGLSLDDSGRPGSNTIETIKSAMSPKARFRLLTEDGPSLPGSPGGHDADDEREQDEVESDGYLEDDEGDEDDFDIQQRLRAMSVSKLAIPPPSKQHRYQKLAAMGTKRPLYLQEHLKDDNASEPTMVAPPSPLLLPNTGRELDPEPDMAGSIYPHVQLSPPNRLARKAPFGSIGEDGLRNNRPLQQQRQFPHQQPRTKLQHPLYHHHHHHRSLHHERKISIPEFMLPPPLHTEQTYVIIDPSAGGCERNPPRRDSGHCDSS
ncbi:hypothetical protein BGX34_010025 [Mortierella sp. NVP85]|nr:hypothetical protein BGX34_010025 [Mortierella sp. NVP85]